MSFLRLETCCFDRFAHSWRFQENPRLVFEMARGLPCIAQRFFIQSNGLNGRLTAIVARGEGVGKELWTGRAPRQPSP